MKTSKFSNEEVNAMMEERGINRKSALKFLSKDRKTKVAPAVDGKQAAANDVEFANPVDAPIVIDNPNKKTRKPKTVGQAVAKAVNKVEAGAARAEGLRLYKLAGRPNKAQFIKVYGKRGHLMTWDQRAEAGIPAEKFQSALAEKQGK